MKTSLCVLAVAGLILTSCAANQPVPPPPSAPGTKTGSPGDPSASSVPTGGVPLIDKKLVAGNIAELPSGNGEEAHHPVYVSGVGGPLHTAKYGLVMNPRVPPAVGTEVIKAQYDLAGVYRSFGGTFGIDHRTSCSGGHAVVLFTISTDNKGVVGKVVAEVGKSDEFNLFDIQGAKSLTITAEVFKRYETEKPLPWCADGVIGEPQLYN